jgi:hypothetical protein
LFLRGLTTKRNSNHGNQAPPRATTKAIMTTQFGVTDGILRGLIRASHERQFNGEDYQAVLWDFAQSYSLSEDDERAIMSPPDPGCDCGFCAKAPWID